MKNVILRQQAKALFLKHSLDFTTTLRSWNNEEAFTDTNMCNLGRCKLCKYLAIEII
ncbi:MAG: hypothetical protein E3K37_04305 [Candidatus Kuenenia sp.]|nr:hypothetical protein [Candidatus Kuenenia hertensis]